MSISKSHILQDLEKFCRGHKTFSLAAKALKVTSSQLSTVRSGKSNVIPARILKKLGYKTAMVYYPVGGNAVSSPKKVTKIKTKPVKSSKAVKPVKRKTHKINRSAVTGRAVTKVFADENPDTTILDTVPDAEPAEPLNVFERH